jgi:hypothetical protein
MAAAITAITAAAILTNAQTVQAQETITGLTTGGGLFNFNSNTPGTYSSLTGVAGTVTQVQGLGTGFVLEDIDYRPTAVTPSLNGVLYGLGKSVTGNQASLALYTISTSGDNAGTILTTTLLAGPAGVTNPFVNANYSIDFNPAANALRIVNDAGANYRIAGANLGTGTTLIDGGLSFTGVLGAAYTNNFGGTGTTSLYEVSYTNTTDTLYLQSPPNDGTLSPVGTNLGVNLVLGGFDISGLTGNAYYGGGSSFYQINLQSGTATTVGTFATNVGTVRGIAAQVGAAAPEPGSLALVGLGLVGIAGGLARRRRQK